MSNNKKIKTNTITDVIKVTQDMGDELVTSYKENGDLKVATVALDAYKTAINGAKTQLIYKKLTGEPGTINFLK